MKRGYVRVSTKSQSTDTQYETMIKHGVEPEEIYQDKLSGKDTNRPGLELVLVKLDRGDELLVTKTDRLGRNTLDMLQIIEELKNRGVIVTLIDQGLSTGGRDGMLTIRLLAVIAQDERERILERTSEGRAHALANGVKFGRKQHKSTDAAVAMIDAGASAAKVAKATGISEATYYRLKAKLKAS